MKLTPALKSDLKSYLIKRIREGEQNRDVEIQTPYPLTEDEIVNFKNMLNVRADNIKNTINKDLLGGFVMLDGSNKLDASLLGHLDSIVNSLHAS